MPFQSRVGRAVFVSVCLLLAGNYLSALFVPATGTFHDDGIYLVTAKALAEGHGYRIISMPGEPYQTKYPVLFPWVLSLFWRVYPSFPDNLPWLRLVGLGSLAVWLTCSWKLLRRLGLTRDAAWVVILLVATSPLVVFLSTTFMAEIPFAALMTAGVLVLTRIHDGEERRFDGWLAGLLMGASLLTRALGVATILGGFLALVLARRWRLAAHFTAGALVVVLPWLWWVAMHNTALAAVDSYYSASNYGSWNIVSNYALPDKLTVLLLNAVYTGMAPAAFWDIQTRTWWAFLVSIMFFAVISRGLWSARRHPAAIVIAIYLATVMCWAWPPLRFLSPVAPGIAWLVMAGAPKAPHVVRALAAAIAVATTFQLWNQVLERSEKRATWPVSGSAESWPAMLPLLDWIARETPKEAIVTGNLDPVYFMYTGRKAIRAFSTDAFELYYGRRNGTPIGTVDDFRRRLRTTHASYLIVTPSAGFGEAAHLRGLVAELQSTRPGSLSVVAGSIASGYVVYRIDPTLLG